ncbi:Rieske (2Fe-2S) protein [Tenacibaculum caenipelagi]|uniref:Nitrite reductase/ring-hydroxylating ferredoxin subunit n=1 Tax=Tenacibaculum caenipelagi TaxID=1325435 RepID=A0A4R6TLC2_9FLAO|nr:Rieske 2Fe-2S domain-containing protein [Tenacibaculum caenipelagi]TDQ30204.1 nitrite reductase/ring-hydroxylating ferredoxin subunit [Tenacibaculum caenipelagi]
MKKLFFLFLIATCFSCSDSVPVNNCFSGVTMNAIIDLSLPEYSGLLVPGGESQNTIQGRNVFIFRTGTSGFKAFDQQCPNRNCNSLMTFNGVEITCPCDDKKYNYLADGAPLDGEGCNALMYFVTPINNSQLRISR